MSPGRPTPDETTRTAGIERIRAAKAKRDRDREAAIERIEREFWVAVAAEIDGGVLQGDAAQAAGYTRETVRTSIKKYTAPAE
ncbi:hypothetical protein [Embleya hyalina]|uniref:Uncharacterized protein n=1 Tax=Embleya hyalina TaxID=516124 RepID=A0A401Z3Y7_9ACTN|nr:hypothetical protein [Embleya hyalina]GCE01560.1 hypothetical protein EHYA_09326 [Embleya hyalina]